MKKFTLKFVLALSVVAAMTSCLKDKEFDEHKYGINSPDASPKAVAFPLAVNATNVKGLDAFSTTNQAISEIVVVNAESGVLPTTDVHVTLALDTNIIRAYNIKNGTRIVPLKPGQFSISSNVVTIKAGKLNGNITINIPTTVPFALDSSYGVAFKIVSVDNGYNIAANLNTLIVEFVLKNKYDGRYKMNGRHNRPTYPFPYTNVPMDMYTSGPNSVRFYWIEAASFGHPIGTAPGAISWYGPTVSPNVTFNPTTNLITDVNNADPTGPPISIYTGPESGQGRYDPIAKKMYVYFRYNANDARAFCDTLTYTGPRP